MGGFSLLLVSSMMGFVVACIFGVVLLGIALFVAATILFGVFLSRRHAHPNGWKNYKAALALSIVFYSASLIILNYFAVWMGSLMTEEVSTVSYESHAELATLVGRYKDNSHNASYLCEVIWFAHTLLVYERMNLSVANEHSSIDFSC